MREYDAIIGDDRVGKITRQSVSYIEKILKRVPAPQRITYPHIDLPTLYEADINQLLSLLQDGNGAFLESLTH
jgi:hypothetical protein